MTSMKQNQVLNPGYLFLESMLLFTLLNNFQVFSEFLLCFKQCAKSMILCSVCSIANVVYFENFNHV